MQQAGTAADTDTDTDTDTVTIIDAQYNTSGKTEHPGYTAVSSEVLIDAYRSASLESRSMF